MSSNIEIIIDLNDKINKRNIWVINFWTIMTKFTVVVKDIFLGRPPGFALYVGTLII